MGSISLRLSYVRYDISWLSPEDLCHHCPTYFADRTDWRSKFYNCVRVYFPPLVACKASFCIIHTTTWMWEFCVGTSFIYPWLMSCIVVVLSIESCCQFVDSKLYFDGNLGCLGISMRPFQQTIKLDEAQFQHQNLRLMTSVGHLWLHLPHYWEISLVSPSYIIGSFHNTLKCTWNTLRF